MKTLAISVCILALLILGYLILTQANEDTSKNKWIISSSPTTLIWSKEDLTQKNLLVRASLIRWFCCTSEAKGSLQNQGRQSARRSVVGYERACF
jgi:hypothetical protein